MIMSTTMSVTQALSELKLLRSRIQSAIANSSFITLKKKRDLLDVGRFSTEANASYQSYSDLLNRYNKIKAAIVIANATTKVTIGDATYTVAEAVERKRSIELEKDMLAVMRSQYSGAIAQHSAHTASEAARVERLLQSELSKDSKTSVDTITQLTETFLAQNKAEVIDPLNLSDKIDIMTKRIEEFETKVDWVLSESNGKTQILV